MNITLETAAKLVKTHTLIPVPISDISLEGKNLIVKDRYKTQDIGKMMNLLGIKRTLTEKILAAPKEHWKHFQTALSEVTSDKRVGMLIDAGGNISSWFPQAPGEEHVLDYDRRIEQVDAGLEDMGLSVESFDFNPTKAQLQINTTPDQTIEVGNDGLWKSGTTIDLGRANHQLSNFFLRLACTNGVITKERLAFRMGDSGKGLRKQITNFCKSDTAHRSIQMRVERMQGCNASFREVYNLAEVLPEKIQKEVLPEYGRILADHLNRGYDLSKMSSKDQARVATNINAFDLFNVHTAVATHRKAEIDIMCGKTLNKAAGDMFARGSDLAVSWINIYSKN